MGNIAAYIIAGCGVILSALISFYLGKKRLPSEINKIKADTNLSSGELAEKYQQIASKAADENLNWQNQIREKEEEKQSLMTTLRSLKDDMLSMDEKYKNQIACIDEKYKTQIFELQSQMNEERKESDKWRDWARRLSLQLRCWDIEPVPFDTEEYKQKRMGADQVEDNKISEE